MLDPDEVLARPGAGRVGVRRAASWLYARLGSFAGSSPAKLPSTPQDADPAWLRPVAKEYARRLAHDLTNIVAGTLAGAEALDEAAASLVAAAARDGFDLAARLTALGRQDDLVPAPCDIAATLAAARARLERAAGGPARLRLNIANNVLRALIDRDQFLACVVEMILDARAADDNGAIVVRTRLTYRLGSRDAPIDGVLLEVGTEAAAGSRDAKPDDPRTGATAGTVAAGAGLAMVQSFALRSGGALERYHSGSLTRSTLRLKLIQPKPSAPVIHLPNRGGRHGIDVRAPETGRAPKAVVVDDNDLLRTVLVHGLRARGMEVSEARNAAEARTLLGAGTAMLVSDIVLPGDMDGFILGRWARARNPRLALLFISAFMSARLPQVLANDELASFVRKPIELEGLIEIVDGLMAVRETSAPQLEA